MPASSVESKSADNITNFDFLRSQIIGRNATFHSNLVNGPRLITYADYTASGRALRFIEDKILEVLPAYANTHTEDDFTGRTMSRVLHDAEHLIKKSVNAGPHGRLVAVGNGATGAINKMQEIIGAYIPPATKQLLRNGLLEQFGNDMDKIREFEAKQKMKFPVVFISAYEHHSNDVSWRECNCVLVEVGLSKSTGVVDLDQLDMLLQQYKNDSTRLKIVSMSGGSNVSGIVSPVHEIARIAHRNHAFVFIDFAATAAYVEINMNPREKSGTKVDEESVLDAVFISSHKLLGGPGAAGVLVFNEKMYHNDLGPSVAGGGTVSWVSRTQVDFSVDIEGRETAGTPGIIQTLRAGLAFQLKDLIGVDRIHEKEQQFMKIVFKKLVVHPGVEILGSLTPSGRVGIVSFNIRDPRGPTGRYIHHRLVTCLLNDLFGVQSRAGCSCAGPYGHRLLAIDEETSERYHVLVQRGWHGVKPGWCRFGVHYSMTTEEVEFICDAIIFIADNGHKFISLYDFDMHSGAWTLKIKVKENSACANNEDHRPAPNTFSLLEKVHCDLVESKITEATRNAMFRDYLSNAKKLADTLPSRDAVSVFHDGDQTSSDELNQLLFFNFA